MLGEHYPDEDKNTIPVQVCRLEFRCKRCNKVFSDFSIPLRGYTSETTMLNDALARQSKEDSYYPENVDIIKSHMCEDGGVGVAEYIGLTFKEVKQ